MLSETDWRLLKSVHRAAIDRYCALVLEECAATIRGADTSPHDRYLRLFRMLKERDKSIAAAFNDLRRSTGIQRLAAMIALEVVTAEELERFSAPTRNSATLGKTEDEALENIQDAIREYLEAAVKISKGAKLREVIRNNSFGTER